MYIKILEKETIKLYGRKWKKEMEGGKGNVITWN